MVKNVLNLAMLAAILFVAHVSAQQSKHEKLVGLIDSVKAEVAKHKCEKLGEECESQTLITVFQKTENLALKYKCPYIDGDPAEDCEGNTEKLIRSVTKSLTKRGSIELDTKSRTWIVTDVEARTKIILPFLDSLRNPEFTLGDVLKAFEEVEKRQFSKETLN